MALYGETYGVDDIQTLDTNPIYQQILQISEVGLYQKLLTTPLYLTSLFQSITSTRHTHIYPYKNIHRWI